VYSTPPLKAGGVYEKQTFVPIGSFTIVKLSGKASMAFVKY